MTIEQQIEQHLTELIALVLQLDNEKRQPNRTEVVIHFDEGDDNFIAYVLENKKGDSL